MAGQNGVDISFKDERFLQRVLQEAKRGKSHVDPGAVQRLQNMGFSQEVANIALNIADADEKRALEICMAGLAFTNSGFQAEGDLTSPQRICPPPAPVRCYICGQQHLSEKSLEFHTKACRRRFLLRESKRPPSRQRTLLEEYELPEGVDCLERYYELADMQPAPPKVIEPPTSTATAALLPCQFCTRTFAPDRLERHERACVERPKGADLIPIQRRPAPSAPKATPPVAAVKAYESFCQQLARCPGCARQFRPELLQSHVRQCELVSSKPKTSPNRVPSRYAASPARRGSVDSNSSPAKPANSAPRRASLPSALSFTPPGRQGNSSSSKSRSTPSAATRQTVGARRGSTVTADVEPELLPGGEELCSEALVERGELVNVTSEVESLLRANLEDNLPNAEFVAAFQIGRCAQKGIYDAMKESMRCQMPNAEEPAERELWHGTSWSIVSKILRHGFNRSFAGRHGTLLGVATYFSVDLAYSSRFCDRRGGGRDHTKVMLLSNVLIGNYCKGCSTDVEPPVADEDSGARFDSTVDNEDRPKIFAVFRDFQAVPLFLLEFRTETCDRYTRK